MEIKVPTPKAAVRADIVEFQNADVLFKKLKEWNAERCKFAEEYPKFCVLLDSLMESQLGFEYDEAHLDAARQRLMIMSMYIAWKLDVSSDAVSDILLRAYKFVWPGVADRA